MKKLMISLFLISVSALSQTYIGKASEDSLVQTEGLKVSGRLLGVPEGQNLSLFRVTLLPRSLGIKIVNASVNSDGSFEVSNVPPGSYGIQAQFPPFTMKQPVTIEVSDHDVSGIELVLMDTEAFTRLEGLEKVWSLNGRWNGLVGDESRGVVFASSPQGAAEIDSTGKIVGQFSLPYAGILRLAHFSGDGEPQLLTFGTWTPSVKAYNLQGTLLWTYPPENGSTRLTGIDDVWPIDIDGDRSDEVIIGFNGATGLHILNSQGQLIWSTAGIGNVWHVSGGDVLGNGQTQVVTTSAVGQIHVFSPDGKTRQNINPGFYATMVRVARPSNDPAAALILATGSAANAPAIKETAIAALTGDGAKRWSITLEGDGPSVYSASVAPGKPWLALGMQSGQIYVVDIERGTVIGQGDGQGVMPDVNWVVKKEFQIPLLVVSARNQLNAFRVAESR